MRCNMREQSKVLLLMVLVGLLLVFLPALLTKTLPTAKDFNLFSHDEWTGDEYPDQINVMFPHDTSTENSSHSSPPNSTDTEDEVTAIPLARRCSNAERVWHLRKSCLESDQDLDKMLVSVKALNYILVDDQRKLLYCSMPKIASTSMKVFLFKLSGMHKDQKILSMVHLPKHYPKFGYRNLASYTSTEAQYRLRNYYKYLFVRHPFDRIASTWREKLVEKNVYIPKLALKIIDKYRTIPAENGSIFEKVPTLPEFAEFIGDNANASNEHWNSIENLCDPCHVRYDYIVRVESMADDIVDILSLHGHNLTLDEHQNYHGRKAELQLRVRFETFDELAKRAISALRHRYEPDFKHFGYEFTDSGELVCEINSPEGACC